MGPQPQGSGKSKFFLFILGLLIGGLSVGAYFHFYVNGANEADPTQVTNETDGVLLSVDSPNMGAVVSEKEITVAGKTGKDVVIVITGGKEAKIVETSSGSFSEKVEVAVGHSKLTVYAFDTVTGENLQSSKDVLYLSSEIASRGVLVASEHTSSQVEEKIDEIKEKLATESAQTKEKALGLPKTHIFGSVVSKSETTLTVNTETAGTKTVLIDDLTKILEIGPKSNSSIKLDDLEIGDRVSVAGVSIEDTIGTAKYVIKEAPNDETNHAVFGEVKEVDDKNIVLTDLTKKEVIFNLKITKETKITIKGQNETVDISDINEADVVVASGTINKGGVATATKLLVIPGKTDTTSEQESTKSSTPSEKPQD